MPKRVKVNRNSDISKLVKDIYNSYKGLRKFVVIHTKRFGVVQLHNYQQVKGAGVLCENLFKSRDFRSILTTELLEELGYGTSSPERHNEKQGVEPSSKGPDNKADKKRDESASDSKGND